MRTFLKGTFAVCLAIGLLATCNVFLPDGWGVLNWPCDADADCSGGFNCQWNTVGIGLCVPDAMPDCTTDYDCFDDLNLPSAFCNGSTCIPFDNDTDFPFNNGFGDRCISDSQCNTAGAANKCICFFDEENCFCSEECTLGGQDCDVFEGSAMCTAIGGLEGQEIPYACGRLGFALGSGAECPNGDNDCAPGTVCVDFENAYLSHSICASTCPQGSSCPWNLECQDIGGSDVCAFRDWLGFYFHCDPPSDCSTFPYYNECPADFCTRTCDNDNQCPDGTYCHLSGYCDLP